ncbi:hypothetical protein HGI47_08640 [Novosphingobium sp. ERN07]|uniref:hypothetical protein n=1 Tax=Novosphingobium sp. ERN07 TaxID=2726187 RepID=UPI00145716A9|nr:hypothetical protein [Novosphingobium sp. ERN07]NLR70938.1 hypothetical protein [Novosphingobium sp. ERN07]
MMVRTGMGRPRPPSSSGSAAFLLEARDPAGAVARHNKAAGALASGGRQGRAHDQSLMAGIEIVEVHKRLPLRKRERTGLSAGDAYNGRSADGLALHP